MTGLIINGRSRDVPNSKIVNYLDDPRLALKLDGARDGAARELRVSMFILHTTKGWPDLSHPAPQEIRQGYGPGNHGEATALFWSTQQAQSGAHLIVDHDGTVYQTADLALIAAFHAGNHQINHRSIGIELYQGSSGELYMGQLMATVALLDWLTLAFRVQRQVPKGYMGYPVPRLVEGGSDVVGILGHCHCSDQRTEGDPGRAIFDALRNCGYEAFDFYAREDMKEWGWRQGTLDTAQDGIPGMLTCNALTSSRPPRGIWVQRPIDSRWQP